MPSEPAKKNLIGLFLFFLTVSAFLIRLENFKNSPTRGIDEMVYFRLGYQLKYDLSHYTIIPYAKELEAEGRTLPEYFFKPLFKHPPFFPLLLSLSLKIFGNNLLAASYVPLLMGALAIPVIYLLGTVIYNYRVGLLSAVFLSLDPISMICSQKIWMDSSITFFTLLAVTSFVLGLKRKNGFYFLLSGISAGLVMNIKYSGVLIPFIFLLYVFLYEKSFVSNRKFLLSIVVPFFLMIPWALWNYQVYGADMFRVQEKLHEDILWSYSTLVPRGAFAIPLIGVLLAVLLGLKKLLTRKAPEPDAEVEISDHQPVKYIGWILVILFTAVFMREHIFNSLRIDYVPRTSWQMGFFMGEPLSFYFGQLIEFSPIFIFAFYSLLLYQPQEPKEAALIRFSALIILFFFIVYGNYQSRYIASSIPFLIILASRLLTNISEGIIQIPQFLLRNLLLGTLAIAVSYILLKTIAINYWISFPNDLCYF